jgi:hypothetical protein
MPNLYGRYVDPDTSSWIVDDYGRFERIESALGYVYGVLMTEKGSIEELPNYGSNIRKMKYLTPGITSQINAAIDDALRPLVGKKFDSYTRWCRLQNGAPLFGVEIKRAGQTAAIEIPLSLG